MPAPPDTLLVSASPGELRLASRGTEGILDLAIVREGQALDGIWLGRVVELAGDVAFVDIGQARPGVLPRDGRRVGEAVVVQALADPRRDKGAKLTTAIALTGRYVVYQPAGADVTVPKGAADPEGRRRLTGALAALAGRGEGLTARRAAAGAAVEDVAAEVEWLRGEWRRVAEAARDAVPPACLSAPDPVARMVADLPTIGRILVDDASAFPAIRARFPEMAERDEGFTGEVDDAIAEALAVEAGLPGGGRLLVEETAAAVVIDVDAGGAKVAGVNDRAAAEVARQVRLRNLSGQMLVDFIVGPGGGWTAARRLARLLADDPLPAQVLGVTKSGMVEIVRERRRASLAEVVGATYFSPTAETVALAALRAVVRESRTRPEAAGALLVAPEIAAVLARLRRPVEETERRLGRRLEIREAPGRERHWFEVI